MRRHPLAENQKLLHPQRLADLRARLAADDHRLDLRQVAFEVLGVLVKKQLADHRAEDGIPQKLQPFVGGQAVLGARSVGQGSLQQLDVVKLVADPLLAVGKEGDNPELALAA